MFSQAFIQDTACTTRATQTNAPHRQLQCSATNNSIPPPEFKTGSRNMNSTKGAALRLVWMQAEGVRQVLREMRIVPMRSVRVHVGHV